NNRCPICSMKNRVRPFVKTIKDVIKIANKRGFILISNKFCGMKKKYMWRCQNGHEWNAVADNVKQGTGCPYCCSTPTEEKCRFIFESLLDKKFPKSQVLGRLGLDGYCEELGLAFEYQGIQHYNPNHYFHQHNKESFNDQIDRDNRKSEACKQRNIIKVDIPYTEAKTIERLEQFITAQLHKYGVKINSAVNWDKYKGDQSLVDFQNSLEIKNIKLLSKAYMGSHSKHRYECNRCNYQWEAVARDVRNKSGCPQCAGNRRYNINDMHELAKKSNLRFLSNEYLGANTKRKWQCCTCEYIWNVKPSSVRNGKRCPKCSGNLRITYDRFKECIQKKNIQLLERYQELSHKYPFKCLMCNYRWNTTASAVWSKGCPQCSKNKKKLTKLLVLAEERGLKLLTSEYLGLCVKHEWQCLNCDRIYQLKPTNVRHGTSCRTCKLRKRKEVI
ncbi:hypothetical protein LCGC14_0979360, partial [marine sediment metagenome]